MLFIKRLSLLFLFCNLSWAINVKTDSPHATLMSFLNSFKHWEGEGQKEVLKTMDLDFLPTSLRSTQGPILAEYLKEVIDRTVYLDFNTIPHKWDDSLYIVVDHEEGIVSLTIGARKKWRFSESTLRDIEEFYQRIKSQKIISSVKQKHKKSLLFELKENYFGEGSWLGGEIFLLKNWQWTGLILLFTLGAILQGTFSILAPRLTQLIHNSFFKNYKTTHEVIIYKPLGHLIMSLIWMNSLPLLAMPLRVEQVLFIAAKIFFSLTLVWTSWRLVDWIIEILTSKANKTESKFDDLLIPFIRTGLRVFVLALTLVLTAETLNLPIQNLIAGLGIGAMAFAFAAKDTIENLFGSLTILLDRPFNIGDWVVIDGVEGTIEKLGFRSTRIRTFYNSQITLPNSKMISATVDNMGEREYRRIKTSLAIAYETPASKITLFTQGIRTLIDHHPYTRKDYYQVYFNQYSASSLDILLYCFLKVPDWSTELQEKERLFIDILKLAQKLGVEFAYPTQTIQMASSSPEVSGISMAKDQVVSLAKEMAKSHFVEGQKPPPPKI